MGRMVSGNRGAALTSSAIARALTAKGLTDVQARTILGGATSVEAGLQAIGLMRAPAAPAATFGLVTVTADGSTGQTYSGPAWTSPQWYRESRGTPKTRTAIAGATATSYVAQAADEGFRLVMEGADGGVRRLAPAWHVVLPPPLLLESFDVTTGFTLSGAGTAVVDAARKVQGAAALAVTRTPTFNHYTKATIGTYDPATLGTLAYHFDAGDDPELAQIGAALGGVSLGQGGSYPNANAIVDGSSVGPTNENAFMLGGHWVAQHVSENAGIAALSASTAMGVRVGPYLGANAPQNGKTWLDGLYARAGGRPTVILGFDDGLSNQHGVIAPLLEARGLRGTFYLPTARIGGGGTAMSEAQALDLYARGHDLQIDGMADDSAMTSAASVAAVIADIQAQKAWFAARSLPVPQHLCYPNGLSEIVGARVALNAVAYTAGANTCTVSSASGITVGMKVTSNALPTSPAVTVTAINGTTITLSANALTTTSTGGTTFVNASGPFHTGKLQAALKAEGIKSARTTKGGSWLTRYGPSGRALIHPGQTTSGQSAAQMQAAIDNAILRGTTLEFFVHAAVTTTPVGTEVALAELTTALDNLKARVDAGVADALTKSQWWARDGAATPP